MGILAVPKKDQEESDTGRADPGVHELHRLHNPVYSCYAKINLGLRIIGKRDDGFHDIETVFHRIQLADSITFAPAERISLVTDNPSIPGDERNICYAAASMLHRHIGPSGGARITLAKLIPVGAGLGGGSSDAAIVLRRLPGFWGVRIEEKILHSIALELGSDVPFFLGDRSAFARGRGELLEYFDLDIPYAILLVHPGIHVSTSWAYAQVTPTKRNERSDLLEILRRGIDDPRHLRDCLKNDFEPVVFSTYPGVLAVRDDMNRLGAVYAAMSGSGSSIFGLFPDTDEARHAGEHFRGKGYFVSITPPHFRPDLAVR